MYKIKLLDLIKVYLVFLPSKIYYKVDIGSVDRAKTYKAYAKYIYIAFRAYVLDKQ